jgi:hypothetical protein
LALDVGAGRWRWTLALDVGAKIAKRSARLMVPVSGFEKFNRLPLCRVSPAAKP